MIDKIVIASNNTGKINEFKNIFCNYNVKLLSLVDLNIKIDINESGKTFEENAYIKAKTIYDLTKLPVIADDSGLMVSYLNGAPGVMSARYAGENASDIDRINKLLSEMKNADINERIAKFVCSILFIVPVDDINFKVIKTQGECYGKIAIKPQGVNGFGYDPIFLVGDKSFAQLTQDEKNKISHRGKALRKLQIKLNDILK